MTSGPPSLRLLAPGAAALAAALWGFGGVVAGQVFRRGVPPLDVVAFRSWISFAGLSVLLAVRRRPRPLRRPPWALLAGFGLGTAAANALLFLAISRLPVAVALVLQALAPVLLIGGPLLAARRLPPVRIAVGVLVALVGVAFVVQLPTARIDHLDLVGIGCGLGTAAAVAAYSVFGARAATAYGAVRANTYAFAVSSLLWVGYFLLRYDVPHIPTTPVILSEVALIGLAGTLAPFLLYAWATARVGAAVGTIVMSLEPLFGAVLAYAWLGQRLTVVQLLGGATLLGAVIYLQEHASALRLTAAPAVPDAAEPGHSTQLLG